MDEVLVVVFGLGASTKLVRRHPVSNLFPSFFVGGEKVLSRGTRRMVAGEEKEEEKKGNNNNALGGWLGNKL